jgi:hypothetical protein
MGSKSRLLQALIGKNGVNSVPTQGLKWRMGCPSFRLLPPATILRKSSVSCPPKYVFLLPPSATLCHNLASFCGNGCGTGFRRRVRRMPFESGIHGGGEVDGATGKGRKGPRAVRGWEGVVSARERGRGQVMGFTIYAPWPGPGNGNRLL